MLSALPDALVTAGLPRFINAGAPAVLVAEAGTPHLINAGAPALLVAEASGWPVARSVSSLTMLTLCTAAKCSETQKPLSARERLRLLLALSTLLHCCMWHRLDCEQTGGLRCYIEMCMPQAGSVLT